MKRMIALLCAGVLALARPGAGVWAKEPEIAIPAGTLAVTAEEGMAAQTAAQGAALSISAPSAVLMEASTQ